MIPRLNQTGPVSILLVVELGLGLCLSGGWMNEATKKFLDGWRKIGSLHVTICSPPKDNQSIEAGVYIFKDGKMAMEDKLGRAVRMKKDTVMETKDGQKIIKQAAAV